MRNTSLTRFTFPDLTSQLHKLCFVLARGVVQRQVQLLRPEAVVIAQGAQGEPADGPNEVGSRRLRIVHEEGQEAKPVAERRRQLEPPERLADQFLGPASLEPRKHEVVPGSGVDHNGPRAPGFDV